MSGLHLRHWPGDSARPALALHCMMGSGSAWGPIAAGLKGRVDLRGFDMPGHGRSDAWLPQAEGPDYHTAVTRLAAAMIDRPLDLIGHSFGATVALRIAVAAPEAVRSLTLIEPVLFAASPDPEQDARDREMAELLDEGRDTDAAAAFLAVWGAQDMAQMPRPARAQVTRQIRLVAATHDALRHDSARILRPGGLEQIEAPVLLIQGDRSPEVIRAISEALAARLPDVGRASVPGAGHMAPLTHPAQVAGLIAVNLDRS
ncbi:alpha/beta fold hydrolase [Paracoccus liaowanqingii]|uniref:Alpha/beta fold hydrolase n=1 Tax=Paracoccus liaowanqingii TaxID=2560053 RepID=A0A4Z1BTS9_9RHOB|nr:alpha/beta fold hydrolase [Paracoccus liaowanqingii]TGN56578.1 alpha/beta fold hydrolase [Paracoccus liaowanqingii]